MDVECSRNSDLQQNITIPTTTTISSTSIQPPPYTAQDEKEFQEKEKLQKQVTKGVDYVNVNLVNSEAAINETEKGVETAKPPQPIIVATTTIPSTSIQPLPCIDQDEKEFQEKEKLQEEVAKGVGFANVNVVNSEAAINETEKDAETAKIEEPNEYAIMFSEKSIRRAFSRKVFCLLIILLLISILYCAVCTYFPPFQEFWSKNLIHVLWGLPVYFAAVIIIICCPKVSQHTPLDCLLLFMFSSSLTYIIGGLCAGLYEEVVMIALGMTAALFLSLTIFASQTKFDFIPMNTIKFSVAFVLVITTALCFSIPSIAGRIALSGLIIFIFSILLIFDMQYFIDGDHRYKLSPEEHIFAVTILYLDISNLLLVIINFYLEYLFLRRFRFCTDCLFN